LFFVSPTRPPPRSTLFPYTTLFRSERLQVHRGGAARPRPGLQRVRARDRRGGGRGARDRERGPRACLRPVFPERGGSRRTGRLRSEEHTSELQSRFDLVCRLLLEKK